MKIRCSCQRAKVAERESEWDSDAGKQRIREEHSEREKALVMIDKGIEIENKRTKETYCTQSLRRKGIQGSV
ncbi:hypothetical protein FKM82_028510 [Ascaphus truei]